MIGKKASACSQLLQLKSGFLLEKEKKQTQIFNGLEEEALMGSGRGNLERVKRASRTMFFVVIMVGSLLVSSGPFLLTLVDILTPCILLSVFTCCNTCFRLNQGSYSFRSSLLDIPLLSLARALAIFCAYSICGLPNFTYGPYLATAAFCAFASGILLIVKTSLFIMFSNSSDNLASRLKQSWIMPLLLSSSMVLALGHIVLAYRIMCQARRKLHFYGLDPETVQVSKPVLDGYQKLSRKTTKMKKTIGKFVTADERDLPPRMLADKDSLFMVWEGLRIHYKKCEGSLMPRLVNLVEGERMQHDSKIHDNSDFWSPYAPLLNNSISDCRFPFSVHPSGQHIILSGSHVVDHEGLTSGGLPLRAGKGGTRGQERSSSVGLILIHGFGGGVFSWRHVILPLAAQVGWTVAAFDRPGWGLTSRPSKADWEKRGVNNPYELHSQVDLLFAFCCELNLTSVVLVGHDDGGLLALMAAAKFHTRKDVKVEVKGVVLVGVSLSREVVSPFARVLLHTSLGRHMLRPLLRSEIGQVTNRRAWYNASKLTSDVLELYKAPLHVAGWDKALAEVSRAAMCGLLSSISAAELLKLVHDLPALVISGIQDMLVPLQSAQALAVQLPCSRLVAISSCGHLPHEENPGELLAALISFVSDLQTNDTSVH